MGDARQNKYMIQNNLGVTQAGLPCVPTDLSTLHFVNFRQRSSSRRLVLPPFTLIQIQCNLASCRTRPLSMCAAAVFIPGSCRTRPCLACVTAQREPGTSYCPNVHEASTTSHRPVSLFAAAWSSTILLPLSPMSVRASFPFSSLLLLLLQRNCSRNCSGTSWSTVLES